MADRLNSYNHYLGTPDYLAEGHRALSRGHAGVGAGVREAISSRPTSRVVVHAVPGRAGSGRASADATGASRGAGQGGESINADEPWRNEMPKRGPARPLQLATPASATLPNGLTLILNERRGLPIVAANLVLRTGSDANPLDKPGLANFVAAMLDEGTATRNALQIADEVAQLGASLGTGSSMDATTISARSLSKNFPATLEILLADVVAASVVPGRGDRAAARAAASAQLVQQRDNPAQVAAQVTAAALYGPKHPYGYSEIGTEASVKAITRDDMAAFWKQNFVPEQRRARRRRRHLDGRTAGAGREGVRRLAARHAGAAGARRADDDHRARRDRRQAGQPADAGARREHRRARGRRRTSVRCR